MFNLFFLQCILWILYSAVETALKLSPSVLYLNKALYRQISTQILKSPSYKSGITILSFLVFSSLSHTLITVLQQSRDRFHEDILGFSANVAQFKGGQLYTVGRDTM